jgi:selenocysteine-specific elongation factor
MNMSNYILELQRGGVSPPTDNHPNSDLLTLLIDRGEVVKLSEEVVLAKGVYEAMVTTILSYMGTRGSITVGEARDLFDTSRKYVLPFLEYLDNLQITRRSGEGRVLIGSKD